MSTRAGTAVLATIVAMLLTSFTWAKRGENGGGKPGGGTPADPAVAFLRDGDIWVADATGANAALVIAAGDGVNLNAPRWTPDGHIGFVRLVVGQEVAFCTIASDGTGFQKLITFDPGANHADWSPVPAPDGKFKIAFAALVQDDMDIFVVNPDGTGLVNLTQTPGHSESQPVWSHDGTAIAFSETDNQDIGVIRIQATGGALSIASRMNVTSAVDVPGTPLDGADVVHPQWAQTTDRLLVNVYSRNTRGNGPNTGGTNWDVWLIDLANLANPSNLTDTSGIEHWPSWTTQDAMFSYSDQRGDLLIRPLDGSAEPSLLARNAQRASWRRTP